MPKRRTSPPPSRFAPVFRAYLEEVSKGRRAEIAEKGGPAENTLSEQVTGSRPATLETVEKVSRALDQTVTKVLIALFDASTALDKKNPDWENDPAVLNPRNATGPRPRGRPPKRPTLPPEGLPRTPIADLRDADRARRGQVQAKKR